ncbi:MAG TPA: toll/interleukin-1 receptor domain-containing protein [bacterium]|nr:toll/interleukin-1 receptor domain-containing protein [bacterium]
MNADPAGIVRPAAAEPHVVIPFNYADHRFARKLSGALRRDGISPWVDEIDMSAGALLVNRLAQSVRPVDFVIPLISASSLSWRWVKQELGAVSIRDIRGRRVRVLPARVDGSALPPDMVSQPYIDFHGRGWDQAYEDLKAVIQQRPSPRPEAPSATSFARPRPAMRPKPAEEKPRGKVLFVSYDYDKDGYYRDILQTWAKMPDFAHVVVNDQRPAMPLESEAATSLKNQIIGKIKSATGFLCVVGDNTATNEWVAWEIKTAIAMDKRMMVVRTNRESIVPDALAEVGPTAAMSFTFEGIKRAIDEAYGVISLE